MICTDCLRKLDPSIARYWWPTPVISDGGLNYTSRLCEHCGYPPRPTDKVWVRHVKPYYDEP